MRQFRGCQRIVLSVLSVVLKCLTLTVTSGLTVAGCGFTITGHSRAGRAAGGGRGGGCGGTRHSWTVPGTSFVSRF